MTNRDQRFPGLFCSAIRSMPQIVQTLSGQLSRHRTWLVLPISRRCLENLPSQEKAPHLKDVRSGKSPTMLAGQIGGQLIDDLLSVVSTVLSALFVLDDATANFPVRPEIVQRSADRKEVRLSAKVLVQRIIGKQRADCSVNGFQKEAFSKSPARTNPLLDFLSRLSGPKTSSSNLVKTSRLSKVGSAEFCSALRMSCHQSGGVRRCRISSAT